MFHDPNTVLQPFSMEINPVKKLVLFNFNKNPDTIYCGLELQWLESEDFGKGFRLIAYRNDEYVDVYDDITLRPQPAEGFEVCGKGLKHYQNISFSHPYMKLVNGNMHVHFSLLDYKKRKIDVTLEEHSKRKSRPFDLIAPVGVSSEQPTSLPIYAMYHFDLIRKRNTETSLIIDGKNMILDSFPFPIPKDGQMRYFMRYGYDCELVDLGRSKNEVLSLLSCSNAQTSDGNLQAAYTQSNGLYGMKVLTFCHSKHTFSLLFENAFPDLLRMKEEIVTGKFTIQMDETMGSISGDYTVKKQNNHIEITLEPSDGWFVENKMFLTKFMLQKKSVFRQWPMTYRYTQHIDLDTLQSNSSWIRLDKGIKWNL